MRQAPSIILCIIQLAAAMAHADDVVYRVRDEVLHRIDPRLFGQFMERPSWGEIGPEGALVPGTNELQPQVLELIERMNAPILRFPGGTDVDYMDWRDMISNVPGRGADRPVSIGHKGHRVTNNFGYDEFLRLCEQLSSEPTIVVNFRDVLREEQPPAEAMLNAAGLVAYCNAQVGAQLPEGMPDWPSVRAENGHPEPYGVRYWQLGNETWGFYRELGERHGEEAARYYADRLVALARAMLAIDPDIQFLVDGHGPTYEPAELARRELGEKIEYTVFHLYTPWAMGEVLKRGEPVPVGALSAADIWRAWVAIPHLDEEGLSVLRHPLLTSARRDGYRLAVTEWNWNGWWSTRGAALSSSFAKGVGAAGYLHALMRSADVIEVGCQSMLVGNSWGIHAVWADREGKTPPHYVPSGQATMLYSRHHGAELLAVEGTGIPTYSQPYKMGGIEPQPRVAYLDALASAGERTVYFHVINRHFDEPMEISIDLTALHPLEAEARHYRLEGRLNDEPGEGEPRQVARITDSIVPYDGDMLRVLLPARSVSCIELGRMRQGG